MAYFGLNETYTLYEEYLIISIRTVDPAQTIYVIRTAVLSHLYYVYVHMYYAL